MLHQIAVNTGINLVDRKITNHSARRTAIMLFKASDTPEDELMAFSGHRSREGIRSYSRPTDDQRLNSVASLIPFATVEEDLEEYYNFFGQSYITYESEEDNAETDDITSNSDSRMLEREISTTTTDTGSETEIEVIPTSNNRIDHVKNESEISNPKRQHNSQENLSLNAQEQS
ncbi:20872_t:CDS:2, partial [Gigaspora margarita]